MSAFTPEEYRAYLAKQGLRYGVHCKLIGWLDEGAEFMFIAGAENPWAWCLVLRGDMNNFREGMIRKVNAGLEPIP